MWPRHTGDFALLRIYTGPDGKPADYSKDNIPLKPRHFLPISLKGVQQKDFAMIMGYPGSTDRYLTSFGVKQAIEKDQPARVKIREERLRLMKEDMDKSDEVRIKYSSKYAQVSNYWKYFMGQTAGLKRLKVYDKKKQLEADFMDWVAKDEARKKKYGSVISDFEKVYENAGKYILSQVYLQEAAFGSEIILFALRNMQLNMT
ncbi:MAG: S46 family peptidase, partial [Bacteroidia bacterium]